MTSPIAVLVDRLDRRFGRRADPPSLWPTDFGALISHAAIVAFLVLTVTGIALALAYRPSVDPVTYHGASELYDGQELPHAFASIIRISEDLPGGLLLRRLHTVAAHLLMISLVAHLLRTLATGAFRHPRLLTHLSGVGLLLVALGFSYTGDLLPFSLVSGSSLRIAEAVLNSIPFVGEQLVMLLFGGELPSQRLLTLAWAGHVLLLPAAFVGLVGVHLVLVHRRRPALRPRAGIDVEATALGRPLWPDAFLRFSLLTAGLTALLLISSAMVPWSDLEFEGPFLTAEATNSVHPHWALFFLTGGLRVVPAIDLVVGGVRITNVLVAGVVIPGMLVIALTIYPFVERAVTHDRQEHHTLDRLLDVPLRAGVVTVMTTISAVLAVGGGVDVISHWTTIPVELVVLTFRVLVIVLPIGLGTAAVVAARRRVALRSVESREEGVL
jgi:ubiquinol-cytochrome c reductase cytochrome b subunit